MHPSKAMIIDMMIAVHLNPLMNPNLVVRNSARKILETYPIPKGLCAAMLMSLSDSHRSYDALIAGIKKLEQQGETI